MGNSSHKPFITKVNEATYGKFSFEVQVQLNKEDGR
jgi:hypothetical protein